jgi:glycosyltransferase involved in cell wall biosynthesis
MPKISIIIPFYQKQQTVERCLQSVAFSSISYEVIIVDDGSTPPLAESIKDKFPNLTIVRQKNSGPGAARNKGADIAQGEYLLFLDADDFLHQDFEKEVTLLMDDKPEVIVGSFYYVGKKQNCQPFFDGEPVSEGILAPAQISLDQFRTACNFFQPGACMIRKDIFQKTKGYYDLKNILFGEDIYLWFQVLLLCPQIKRTPKILVYVDDNYSVLGVGRKSGKPISALALCRDEEFEPYCINQNPRFVRNFLFSYRKEMSNRLIYEKRYNELLSFALSFPQLFLSWSLVSYFLKRVISNK